MADSLFNTSYPFHGLYDFILLGMKNWGYIMLPFMIFYGGLVCGKPKSPCGEDGTNLNWKTSYTSLGRFCLFHPPSCDECIK